MLRLTLALIVASAMALPASAAGGIAFFPSVAGQRLHYHVVRVAQTANGPQTTVGDFDLVRRAGTTLVLERTGADGAPDLYVLKTDAGGFLETADAARPVDPALADLLYGLGLANAATQGGDPTAHATWTAELPTSAAAGAPDADVVLGPAGTAAGGDFDFGGSGVGAAAAPPRRNVAISGPGGSGGFPGGGGVGGSFPGGGGGGGGFPGRSRRGGGDDEGGTAPGAPPARSSGGMAVAFHVDGHASNGRAVRITITQTRIVTVENLPFVNVGSWTIAVTP